MLERKLIVGRCVNLTLPPIAPPHYNNGDFVLVNVVSCYLEESKGVFTKTSGVHEGVGPKAHRNFKWLPWLPGAISAVNLVGSDVLTGPMSGCWLVTYRRPNGVAHAGHLGTDISSQARTNAVNTAWNNFATANPGSVIGGFNPLRHWNGAFPAATGNDIRAPKIFGLYTTMNQFYIVVTYPQKNASTTVRIAGVQQVQSVNLGRLQHVDLPGP